MPRLSAIQDPILEELAGQLRFTPRGSLLRQIERAEELGALLDAEQQYPREWLMYRVTGFRPAESVAVSTSGCSLLASLSAFVEGLCEAARVTPEDLPPGAMDVESLCRHWGVSRKTIERARRQGLVARRVEASGARQLMFTRESVDAYAARAGPGPSPQGRRLSEEARRCIIRRSGRYRRLFGWSINQCAVRLAGRFGCSSEAIRQMLKRHDASLGDGSVFSERGPADEREQEVAFRALRRGLRASEVGERLGRDERTVRRAALLHRVALLRSLQLGGPSSPVFERADAGAVILDRPALGTASGTGIPRDAASFLELAGQATAMARDSERDLATAMHFLRWRARRGLAEVHEAAPTVERIDAIETDLRRASRLKEALVRGELGLLLATAQERLEIEIAQMPERQLGGLIDTLFEALCAGVDRFDPFAGGRLAAPAGLALDRAALAWMRSNPLERPADTRARRAPASARRDGGRRCTDPWQRWLEVDARLPGVLERLCEEDAWLLGERFGLRGAWPSTAVEVAARQGMTPAHVARWERRAVARALATARGGVG